RLQFVGDARSCVRARPRLDVGAGDRPQPRQLVVGPARDRDPAVADALLVEARECAVQARIAMVVTVAQVDDTVDLVVEQPGRERPDRGLDLRQIEVYAVAGTTPVVQARGERGGDVARRE